jgi:hypothetical protein
VSPEKKKGGFFCSVFVYLAFSSSMLELSSWWLRPAFTALCGDDSASFDSCFYPGEGMGRIATDSVFDIETSGMGAYCDHVVSVPASLCERYLEKSG